MVGTAQEDGHAVARDGIEDHVGDEAAVQDDSGGAVEHCVHDEVLAEAVEERQEEHRAVSGGNPQRMAGTVHVRDDVAMAKRRTLLASGRARRVEDGGGGVAVHVARGDGAVVAVAQRGEREAALRRSLADDDAVGGQGFANQRRDRWHERLGGEKDLRASVIEHVAQLAGGEHAVGGDGDGAELDGGQVGDGKGGDVGQEERDAVARLYAEAGQAARGPVHLGEQLAVGDTLAFEEDRGLVGEVRGGALDVLRDVHAVSPPGPAVDVAHRGPPWPCPIVAHGGILSVGLIV